MSPRRGVVRVWLACSSRVADLPIVLSVRRSVIFLIVIALVAAGVVVASTGSKTIPIAPAHATAFCKDGTYSYSQDRSRTCASHGGVSVWL